MSNDRNPLNSLKVLERAITDVGVWSWWGGTPPGTFQVEFAGVQLWNPPVKPGGPPSGQVAIAFDKLVSVAFLNLSVSAADASANWPQQLQQDQLRPPAVSHDLFTLTSPRVFADTVRAAAHIENAWGADVRSITPAEPGPQSAFLAFWAGNVGLAVVAGELRIKNHAAVIPWHGIFDASEQWWAYWKDYWRRKDTDQALPIDYACEVTIPLKSDEEKA